MLEIRDLKKNYGKYQVLNGLDMTVPDGSLFGFVGPNGAGKTTTLKIMVGLLEADVTALFREAARDANDPGRLARRFHRGLARGLARWARLGADRTGVTTVALGGGVFNNRTLLAELPAELRRLGLTPYLPSSMPAGDGSISLGQALWGDWSLEA